LDKSLLMPRFCSFLFLLLLTFPVLAQETVSSADLYGTIDYRSILGRQNDYLSKFYFQNVDNVDELVNGKDYIPYYFRSKYKPVLFPGRKHTSFIILKGRKYDNLVLDYDTFLDELVYYDSLKFIDNKVFKISLNKNPIDEFSFNFGSDSLFFRYFNSEKDAAFTLTEGFYEVAYEGKSKVLIRHRSYLMVKEGIDEYMYSPDNYIEVNDVYTKISGKGAFLKLFGERSGEVKKYIHANKVKIHKADKNELASVLRYYDSMNSSNR
jgi:hypothetical protein